jgi:hypothetical protein
LGKNYVLDTFWELDESFLKFRKAKNTFVISQPTFAFTTSGVVHYFGCGRDWKWFTYGRVWVDLLLTDW